MENPFTAYGKGSAFLTGLQTGFPQLRHEGRLYTFPQRLLLRLIIPSDPIQTIQKGSVENPHFSALYGAWAVKMGNLKPASKKANTDDLSAAFQP